ncbi:hypothetical protein GSY74_06865, partial [Sulfurovum sp. bin170]|uniref:hypothetical protein n=1 Tax=Sulfurovum sp. bin170 TaxID=2695268 RepID=UPI0013DF939F
MKSLMVLLVMVEFMVANSLVVKDANVTITIDKKVYELQKGDKADLEQNSTVCFKGGDGRVIIDEQLQLSSESNETCSHLKMKKSFDFKAWFKKHIKVVALLFTDSKEQTKLAVTRKGGESETAKGTMVLKASDEYFVIENKTWIIYPITLEIINNKNKVIYKETSEEDSIIFIVPRNKLETGYKIKVYNSSEKQQL